LDSLFSKKGETFPWQIGGWGWLGPSQLGSLIGLGLIISFLSGTLIEGKPPGIWGQRNFWPKEGWLIRKITFKQKEWVLTNYWPEFFSG